MPWRRIANGPLGGCQRSCFRVVNPAQQGPGSQGRPSGRTCPMACGVPAPGEQGIITLSPEE